VQASSGLTRRSASADPHTTSSATPTVVTGRACGWVTRATIDTAARNTASVTAAATSNPGTPRTTTAEDVQLGPCALIGLA